MSERKALLAAALLFVASRIVLLAALDGFVGGREFSDDAGLHLALVADPLCLLDPRVPGLVQYPPLLPLVQAALVRPFLLVFSPFLALRAGFIVAEALAAAFLVAAVGRIAPARAARALIALSLLPAAWMTSTVMGEEEPIAALALAAALWLHARGQPRAALVVLGTGVAAAKIFLVLPLAALAALAPGRAGWRRLALGLAPALAVYAVVTALSIARGLPLPLTGFHPSALGVNLWPLVIELADVSPRTAKLISSPLSALAAAGVVWLARRRAGDPDPLLPARAAAAALYAAFALFYHVHPEYYLIPLVAVLVADSSPRVLVTLALALTLPWVVNFTHAAYLYEAWGGPGGKSAFVALYDRLVPLRPWLAYSIALGASALTALLLAAGAAMALVRPRERVLG